LSRSTRELLDLIDSIGARQSHPSRYANRAESRFEFLPRPGTLLLALVIFYGIRCAYVFVTLTIAPWPLTQQRESGE
jgi:hypothetical protein